MPRPCHCNRCRLCWLYQYDADYRNFWDASDTPVPPRSAPCIFLGEVIDKLNCPCPNRWVRKCEIHQTCTIAQCKVCEDYQV